MRFLEWNHHIEGLEKVAGLHPAEQVEAGKALLYLQGMLGENFLQRCSAGNPCFARHPLLRTLANFTPSSRRNISRFAAQLKILENSQNFGNVLDRLHDLNQFEHDALLIKAAARVVKQGLRARFEPTIKVTNNQKQPDLRLQDPLTEETTFVEVVTQFASRQERSVTDTNSAVFAALFGISYELCISGRWTGTPSDEILDALLKEIKRGGEQALKQRILVTVHEQGIVEMAMCHRDDQVRLLDPWCHHRALSGCGFVGPTMTSNDVVRIKRKIRDEQEQLPRENSNVLLILATDIFFRAGGLRRVIAEVEVRASEYGHIQLVILHGQYTGFQDRPSTLQIADHRFNRQIRDGMTETDLVIFNRKSQIKLSGEILGKFYRSF